jgi:hypothetical protein
VTRRHRFVVAISLVLLAASCGGGETELATPSPCTTVAPGPDGSPTPTPCPADEDGAPGAGAAGESWKGTAPNVATSSRNPEASCRDSWELEFTFVVSAEGTIDGHGTADLTSTPTCNFPIDPIPFIDHHEYQVSGEETADGFSIRFGPLLSKEPADGTEVGGLPSIYADETPVELTVSGSSGTGQGMWRFQSGVATLTADGTVTLECVSCE